MSDNSQTDDYRWLEQRDHPAVLDWLQQRNAECEDWLSQHQDRRQALFEEIRGRIRETDLSLPGVRNGWLYYRRSLEGAEYPLWYRCRQTAPGNLQIDDASEQLLLDLNLLAGDGFLQLGDLAISPDQCWLAYSLDRQGDEVYQLYLLEIDSGHTRELPLSQADGSLVWANDNRTLFAISLDQASRPSTLWRLRPDQPACMVYHESDERFLLSCGRSSSEHYLLLESSSKNTSEIRLLPADQPDASWHVLATRRSGHEYHVDHGPQGLLIRSNDRGSNFCLYRCDPAGCAPANWQLLVEQDPQRTLEDFHVQQQALVLCYRDQGLIQLEVRPQSGNSYPVTMPDSVYSLSLEAGEEYHSDRLRLRYESLNRPAQIRALRLADGSQQVLRETPVEGPFNAADYRVERRWAIASDGSRVPISLVGRHASFNAPAPLYLYGYGAYGASLDPWFSHARLSLLERGWIFAIAHVRGGADMGEQWYLDGKLEHKENSFGDFIACAEQLLADGLSTPSQLVISGGSAGGLLIGCVLNRRPELFAAAIAEVPFVDVWNTMNNPSLPLTIGEYEEWGDPSDPAAAARIRGYSPFDNVAAQHYPALYVSAGYHDVRVQYWEAAKWVARLRELKLDTQPLLLRTLMDAGHAGASGRYQAIREVAEQYSFLLALIGEQAD